MIVSANSAKVLKSLQEYHKIVQRKLNNVVRGFAYKITQEAINHTPLGDASAFMQRYIERQEAIGLNPQEGFARGSWQVTNSSAFTVQTIYGINSGTQALSAVQSKLSGLTFRDNIFIGNRGYYIGFLENNYSPQTNNMGIMKPTMQAIMQVYQISIKELYDKG